MIFHIVHAECAHLNHALVSCGMHNSLICCEDDEIKDLAL